MRLSIMQSAFMEMLRRCTLSLAYVNVLLLLLNLVREYALPNYETERPAILSLVLFRIFCSMGFFLFNALSYKFQGQALIIAANIAIPICFFEIIANLYSYYEAYITYCLYYIAFREMVLLHISTAAAYSCESIIVIYHIIRAIVFKYCNESYPFFTFLSYLFIYLFINIPMVGNYTLLKKSIYECTKLKNDFELIISSLPLPIFHFKSDPLKIILSNQKYDELYDKTKELDKFFILKKIMAQLNTERDQQSSLITIEINNTEYLVKMQSLEQEEGTTYVACFQDLSHAKKIQSLILKEIYKHMFISILNHQLRTPLNGILTPLVFIKEKCTDVDTKEYIDLALHSLESLSSLIEDSIAFSECECGNMKIIPTDVNVLDEMSKLIKMFEFESNHKQIPILFEVNVSNRYLHIDLKRIKQIMIILLSNALKYTFKGSIKFEIKEENCKIRFIITDTGTGIKTEQIPHIFTEFSSAERVCNEKLTSSGFQLSLVHKLVEIMKGTINVKSLYNIGTCFEVVFDAIPCRNQFTEPSGNLLEYQLKYNLLNDDAHKSSILVVDDNAANVFVLQKMLKKLNCDSDSAMNGDDCLHKVVARGLNSYQLILMDINMPIMNGLDATAQINNLIKEGTIKDTPIIAVTAQNEDSLKEQCKQLGIKKCLIKPVSIDELKCVIRDTFRSHL